jgi:hypothetical protein
MNKIVVYLFLVHSFSLAQTLPRNAEVVLGHHFSQWHVTKDTIIDLDQRGNRIVTPFLKLFKCNLNGDNTPDYGLSIMSQIDSTLTETFLALIGNDTTYQLFVFFSRVAPKTDEEKCNLVLEKAGTKVSNFGFDDEDNLPEEKADMREVFSTDCITVWCNNTCCSTTYVFENGGFSRFTSGD